MKAILIKIYKFIAVVTDQVAAVQNRKVQKNRKNHQGIPLGHKVHHINSIDVLEKVQVVSLLRTLLK